MGALDKASVRHGRREPTSTFGKPCRNEPRRAEQCKVEKRQEATRCALCECGDIKRARVVRAPQCISEPSQCSRLVGHEIDVVKRPRKWARVSFGGTREALRSVRRPAVTRRMKLSLNLRFNFMLSRRISFLRVVFCPAARAVCAARAAISATDK